MKTQRVNFSGSKNIKTQRVNFSEFKKRITFQNPIKVDDGNYGYTVIWQDAVTVWAKIEPLTGTEYFDAQQIQLKITHRITIRSRKDINRSMRINYGGRIFIINSIHDKNEAGQIMEIMATEWQ